MGNKAILMAAVMLAVILTGCVGNKFTVREINSYFFEAETYTSLDYDYARKYFGEVNDNWGGGCSAVSAVVNGTRLVGRNMDLNISNKCAYFVKTRVPGKYRTIGLAYTFRDVSPDYDNVKKAGIEANFAKILPFMCDDVMNSEGLHIEINMRHGENDADGNDIFGVEQTNRNTAERVYVFNLCQYIALNCKNLEAVKKYLAEEVDVYSQKGYWNYCFIITDAEGNSALLEFGNRRYYWTEPDENGVIAHTNFYVNEECNRMEDIKTGLGRYETIMADIGKVTSKKGLFDLMRKIQYSNFYLPYEDCKRNHFDPRSEVIGEGEGLTYDFVMDPANEAFVGKSLDEVNGAYRLMSRAEKQDLNSLWESTFTEIVNPQEKTIEVRLFENDSYIYRLAFDSLKKISAIE